MICQKQHFSVTFICKVLNDVWSQHLQQKLPHWQQVYEGGCLLRDLSKVGVFGKICQNQQDVGATHSTPTPSFNTLGNFEMLNSTQGLRNQDDWCTTYVCKLYFFQFHLLYLKWTRAGFLLRYNYVSSRQHIRPWHCDIFFNLYVSTSQQQWLYQTVFPLQWSKSPDQLF